MSRRILKHLPTEGFKAFPVVGRHNVTEALPPMGPKRHPNTFELLYLQSGMQFRACDGFNYPLYGGQGFLVKPGLRHSTGIMPVGKGLAYWLHLDESVIRRNGLLMLPWDESQALLESLHAKTACCVQPAYACREQFETLFAINPQTIDAMDRLAMRRAILGILVAFANGTELPHTAPSKLPRIMAKVMADPTGYIDVNHMADEAGLSVSRLRALVKEATGVPLGDWVLRMRMELAMRRLIEEPDTPVTTVALDLKFSSSQYFATVFKRYAACTPREFRELRFSDEGRRRLRKLEIIT